MSDIHAMRNARGFTLIEIAIVLVVTGYLLNQLLVPFAAQFEQLKRQQTQQQLTTVITASTGFALAHQRLPCPAGLATQGVERLQCSGSNAVGFVPVSTLGLSGPVDQHGRLVDSWGRPLVYAVSRSDHPERGVQGHPDFVTSGEMAAVGLPYLKSDLTICSEVIAGRCSRANVRANQVPLVVLSLGADASTAGQQSHNQDTDSLFASRPLHSLQGTRFDDLVLWLSESQLIFHLVKAGSLP